MSNPLIDSLNADEQQAAADLMGSVDFRKLGGGDSAGERGQAGPRDEVDRSTLLTTVNAGSITPGAPVAGTPLPYEFSAAAYAHTASAQRAERDADLAADAGRDALTYATPGEELAGDSRRTRERREQESEQGAANGIDRSDEEEAGNVIDGADGGVVGRTRDFGEDGEAIVAMADGASGAVAGATVAVGEALAPLSGPLGPDQFGPGQLGADRFGQRQFVRDRISEDPNDLVVSVVEDTPARPPPDFADPPVLGVGDAGGGVDTAIALDIRAALTDTDGSESLSITVAGVPEGALLSAGTDTGGGVWILSPDQLSGLAITPLSGSDADFTLTVTATSTEGGDTATTAGTARITVDDGTIFGGADDDILVGTGAPDTIRGYGGDDTIASGNGGDIVYGGAGNDIITGGTGKDVLNGDAGNDIITGGNGKDILSGGAGDDELRGGRGNDILTGGAGNDIAFGEDGADIFILLEASGQNIFRGGGGNWIDVIDVQGANGADPGSGWDFTLTDGSVISVIDGVAKLSKESSGTISLDDGTTLTFTGVEELNF